MASGIIVVRKRNVLSVETLVLPSWVAQYGIETGGVDNEITVQIIARFEREQWELKGGRDVMRLSLECVSVAGRRLREDDFANVTVVMSAEQRKRTRVTILYKPT